jgi:hypothetical protein
MSTPDWLRHPMHPSSTPDSGFPLSPNPVWAPKPTSSGPVIPLAPTATTGQLASFPEHLRAPASWPGGSQVSGTGYQRPSYAAAAHRDYWPRAELPRNLVKHHWNSSSSSTSKRILPSANPCFTADGASEFPPISAPILQQVIQQLPPIPENLPPGLCICSFQVDPTQVGRRSEELQNLGVILFTPSLTYSRDYIDDWANTDLASNLGVGIVQF